MTLLSALPISCDAVARRPLRATEIGPADRWRHQRESPHSPARELPQRNQSDQVPRHGWRRKSRQAHLQWRCGRSSSSGLALLHAPSNGGAAVALISGYSFGSNTRPAPSQSPNCPAFYQQRRHRLFIPLPRSAPRRSACRSARTADEPSCCIRRGCRVPLMAPAVC